jgi:hypothetical protein
MALAEQRESLLKKRKFLIYNVNQVDYNNHCRVFSLSVFKTVPLVSETAGKNPTPGN